MKQKTNWVQNPTKTQLIISLMVYLNSVVIMFAAMTDFFTEPLDLKVNMVLVFLNIAVTFTMIKVVRNYFANLKNSKQ
ncbi:hypothetical protein [Chryseobacterium foetidum]|uniref:hypothetical protein n=1 Tax=Chryseobacterium foetidum TaxID=2951057 RepID=UPI0021C7C85C|nr:hypothetical protein [Chryseobacterium foetidum]